MNATTTTKPGVLAVIDARLRALNKFSAHTNEEAEEIEALTEARAALAELFEVARHVALWMDDWPKRTELRAALARVGVAP